ncbi:SDR family oxidoreductase [Frondihabitans cladoniiphilus]|uniref:SDR family oxidoreductase n=1 Tax=Frondihabitans cladoniiphilus TaxID=715785 RepID=A0ABP8W869_9MICO
MPQRTWFITGVNSGFGRAMTEQLLERGDRVAGTVRNVDSVKDLTDKYGENFWVGSLDLTHTADIRTVVDQAFTDLGTVDVIVNNAGYGLFGAAEELTDEQVEHAIDTNLLGSIQIIRTALPHLRAQGAGRIIQLSTFGGQAAMPGGSMYHATKWGVEGFAEAVSIEVAPLGIGVTIVEPGGARTEFRNGSAKLGPAIEAYAATPAAFARNMITTGGTPAVGDPAKIAAAIIDSADQNPAPKRVVLGSDSFGIISGALTARLADVQSQKDSAALTDFPAGA